MFDFADLVEQIDKTNKTNLKVKALEKFFSTASDQDKVWAIALFSSKKPKRSVKTSDLRVYTLHKWPKFHYGFLKKATI